MSARSGLVVLRGPAGGGRTRVLEALDEQLSEDGHITLRVDVRQRTPWDVYGAWAILEAVRVRFEDLQGDVAFAGAIAALHRICTPSTYESSAGRSAVLAGLHGLLRRADGPARPVILVDDADTLPGAAHVLSGLAAADRLVVAVVTSGGAHEKSSQETVQQADRVVDIVGLIGDEIDTLLEGTARCALTTAAVEAVTAQLGALGANPGALVGALHDLVHRGALVDVFGRLHPATPDIQVRLPVVHPLVAAVLDLGPAAWEVLEVAATTSFDVGGLSALSAATGRSAAEYGAVIDELVRLGVLETAWDGLAVRSWAIVATLAAHAGDAARQELHATLVRAWHGSTARARSVAPAVLADHVVAAGRALDPDTTLVDDLLAEAVRVEHDRPGEAIARYRSAWWHAGSGPRGEEIAGHVLGLAARNGDHAELGRFVADIVRAASAPITGIRRAELAALAALAAMTVGIPVDPGTRRALAGADDDLCPLRLAEDWRAGRPIALGRLVAALAALPAVSAGDRRASADTTVEIGRDDAALRVRDAVSLLPRVMPPGYAAPWRGFAVDLHRVVRHHADGGWEDALTAARSLVAGWIATGAGDVIGLRMAVLLAADIQFWQGRDRQARRWLEAASQMRGDPGSTSVSPLCVAYTELLAGELAAGGDDIEAVLESGWRLLQELGTDARSILGQSVLLRQILRVVEHDRSSWRQRLLDGPPASAPSCGSLVRALLTGDVDGASRAIDVLEDEGRLLDAGIACVAIGRQAAAPEGWLLRARSIATEIGAEELARLARAAMVARDVRPPRGPSRAGLTATERRIIALVRDGQTNRQIARSMNLSEKTVENGLTRLFAKLGCRTRYKLATLPLEELDDPPTGG
ncbi:AAA family ATPase [Pseudonocardia sp. ICBG1122]|nr:AAA family ATPase [Pseudonocardia pini]